jgi:scyllo-inositol 2-dehydrogenase (NADP+)
VLNVGLIGLGKMGISHLAIVNAHPGVKLIGICDTASYLRGVLTKYTGIKTYSDYRTLLADDLNAVIIATPSRFHGEMVRAALDSRVNVFCEKPFCLDVAEGAKLAELADRSGVVNQVGYHYRFVASFNEAKRLIDAKVLGRIHHIRAESYGPVVLRPEGTTWRVRGREGGGCLYDYACHAIDLVNYLVGPPQAVGGTVLNKIFSRDVDDEVYATLYFDDGMTGQIMANWSDESYRRMFTQITIWGTNGKIIADRQEVKTFIRDASTGCVAEARGWNIRHTTDFPADVWYYLRGEEYSAQIDYFFRCIADGRKHNISSFAAALQTDQVVSMLLHNANEPRGEEHAQSNGEAKNLAAPAGFLAKIKDALR